MFRLTTVLGLSFFALALIVGTGQTGGEKKDTQPKKKQIQLPANFGKLGLSDEQKKKIYDVRGSYQGKIDALLEKIETMKKAEFEDCLKLLSDDQRAQYRKIVTKGLPDDKDKKEKKGP
jgi:ribosomal protein L15